jgi:phage internal scaffolding protein
MATPKPGPVNSGEPFPQTLPDEKPTPVASHQYVYQPTAPFVRSPYNYDTHAASQQSGLLCRDPSLAVQDAKDEVDINTIVRNFGLTGQLPENVRAPTYGDFVGVSDYHSAMIAIELAREAFEELPGEVRARFNHDPAAFVDFCSVEGNDDELRKLGLIKPKEAIVAAVAPQTVTAPPSGDVPTS